MNDITIEQAGTIGTANHVFPVSKPVAVAERVADSYGYLIGYRLRSLTSHEVIGELRPMAIGERFSAWSVDEVHGESDLAKSNVTFMEAVTAILGRPGAGYDHYRKAA